MTASQARKVLTFFIGDEQFALSAADVVEIHRPSALTRVPHGPGSLLGIGNLRGVPAPVVSLARLLGRQEQAGPRARLLVVEDGQTVGLAVDRVGTLTGIASDAIPSDGERSTGFGRLYRLDGEGVRVLDLDSLLHQHFAAVRCEARVAAPAPADGAAAPDRATLAFLAFELAGQAYALPIDEIEEVLALPPRLAAIAQADEAALGVTDLRERLLPIVSLRRLLGLPAVHERSNHVLVARIGEARVGLAVDRLRSILRVPEDSIDPAPAVLNRGAGETQVQSICRLPDKKGLVAILSAERLFRDEKMARILADGRDEGDAMAKTTNEAAERFLIFRLGTEEYGLPLAAVDEVVSLPPRMTRLPHAPDFVEGVMTLRGKVIPVIDQRARFASRDDGSRRRPRVVVTTVEGRQAGFIVDSAPEILALGADSLSATPDLAAEAGRLFSRIASLEGGRRLILLVEPKELLDRAERELLADLDASMDVPPA